MMEVRNKVFPLYSRMQTDQLTHATNNVGCGVVSDSHLAHNLPNRWERWKLCSKNSALIASANSQSVLVSRVLVTNTQISRAKKLETHPLKLSRESPAPQRHAGTIAAISLRTFSSFNCSIWWNIFRGWRIQIALIIHRAEAQCHAGGDIRKLLLQSSHCR